MDRPAVARLRALTQRIVGPRGRLDQRVRAAAFAAEAVPADLAPLTAKVIDAAYRVDDADVDRAKRAGYSDDQLFELIAAAAVGAGWRRFAVVESLLEENPA